MCLRFLILFKYGNRIMATFEKCKISKTVKKIEPHNFSKTITATFLSINTDISSKVLVWLRGEEAIIWPVRLRRTRKLALLAFFSNDFVTMTQNISNIWRNLIGYLLFLQKRNFQKLNFLIKKTALFQFLHFVNGLVS